MKKTRSELRREEWQDPIIRARRVEGSRRAALERYQNPEEHRWSAERTKQTFDERPELREAASQRLRKINAARRGKGLGTARGLCQTAEYKIWDAMNQRCHNPKSSGYRIYGARGITVDPTWRGKGGFVRFLDHIGPRPGERYSVDRIDGSRGYEPGNVCWATDFEQQAHTSRSYYITIHGITRCCAAWAREIGISAVALRHRIEVGWPEDALLLPGRRGRSWNHGA